MPLSINRMIREVGEYRDELQRTVVAGAQKELERLFLKAEVALYRQKHLFEILETGADGKLVRSVKNVERAGAIVEKLQRDIHDYITGPGRKWADAAVPKMNRAGRRLARKNLNVDFVSQTAISEIFKHVPQAERALLRVGKDELYTIVNTVGDDVSAWFRREMLDGMIEGIPVVGPGDTLERRLFESGRLRPVSVRTEKGRWIRRSIAQRARSIARIESVKIINATHDTLAREALGEEELVGRNSNPSDSRTTDICRRAARQAPMTREEWINSAFGLPPRLRPFHECRSVMIWGRREWFDGTGR